MAFLKEQQKPLFLEDVIKRLGPTEPGPGEPYYRYEIGSTKIDFWFFDTPAERYKGLKNMAPIPTEISMVVEAPEDSKAHIIWPGDLVGADIRSVLVSTWPKMYQPKRSP